MTARFKPVYLAFGLLLIATLFALFDLCLVFRSEVMKQPVASWLMRLFHTGLEHNLPSTFSAGIALLAGCEAWRIARTEQLRNFARAWRTFAFLLWVLTIDELLAVHEKARLLSRHILTWMNTHVWAHCSDVAFVLPAVLALLVAIFLAGFIFRLPPRMRRLVVLASMLFLGGALFVKAGSFLAGPVAPLLVPVEEGLEMAGFIALLYASMDYASRNSK